ncbi:MAG: T9SS type A sorting domain-containing protein [Bacteroidetes bacterium]|nr:T9SS type A sorting domain-containing protein [Bacteroidota bacterium]
MKTSSTYLKSLFFSLSLLPTIYVFCQGSIIISNIKIGGDPSCVLTSRVELDNLTKVDFDSDIASYHPEQNISHSEYKLKITALSADLTASLSIIKDEQHYNSLEYYHIPGDSSNGILYFNIDDTFNVLIPSTSVIYSNLYYFYNLKIEVIDLNNYSIADSGLAKICIMNGNFVNTILSPNGNKNRALKESQVQIFPLPFDNFLNIKINSPSEKIEISLYDLQGRIIRKFNNPVLASSQSNLIKIPTNSLNNGLFFIKVKEEKSEYILPVLKK